MNEQQLIEGCQKENRKAQRILYDRYASLMMAICYRYVGDRETAGDVLQEGFISVFSSIGSFRGAGSFEGWMKKIFINCSLEYLRKRDVLREASDIDAAWNISEQGEASPVSKLTEKELLEVIESLPAGYRSVFNLYAIEGYSHEEIASMLGISPNTSRSQFMRARMLLQKKINDLYE